MDLLKLVALDGDDIEVVSAHLQDAVIKPADIRWRPGEHRVVVALDRFDWEAANGQAPKFQRRRSALRFERVTSCKCRKVEQSAEPVALNLLAVAFTENDAPGGVVTLTFSGGAALRLEVECLEAELADLGPSWAAECCPAHLEAEAIELAENSIKTTLAKQG
jgi:hypothetical protein